MYDVCWHADKCMLLILHATLINIIVLSHLPVQAAAAASKTPLSLPLSHPTRASSDKKLRKKGAIITITAHVASASESDALKSPVTGNAKLFWEENEGQNFLKDIARFFGPERKDGVWPQEIRAGYEYTIGVSICHARVRVQPLAHRIM